MIRTRFAPSPTGYLHVGGARTALYSWLFAKQHQGETLLRIEDTDSQRNDLAATQAIIDAMQWLGLKYDIGPIFQSQRFEIYRQYGAKLLEAGKAYHSYCTPEQLEAMRVAQEAAKQKIGYVHDPKYDQPQYPGQQPVLRFNTPKSGKLSFVDAVRGVIEVDNQELDDFIILRSDGSPTYNFCVVIDDMLGEITHVIRGEDHINNTFRQIHIFNAFGVALPVFAHVSMINGEDGRKLSKRHGAVSVMEYKEQGYLPQALLNYLVKLGWGYGNQEIFSLDEMLQHFKLESISKSSSSFDFKKLAWLNQQYMKQLSAAELAKEVAPFVEFDLTKGPKLEEVVALFVERCDTLVAIAQAISYLYQEVVYDPAASAKHLSNSKEQLTLLKTKLEALTDWQTAEIHTIMKEVATELGLGMGKVGMPFRVAITGVDQTPAIDALAQLLGKEQVIARLNTSINTL